MYPFLLNWVTSLQNLTCLISVFIQVGLCTSKTLDCPFPPPHHYYRISTTNVLRKQHIVYKTFSSQRFCCFVAKSVHLLCDRMDCSLSGCSVQGISQVRILEWVAISYFRGSSRPMDQTHISCIGRQILYHWATWEAQSKVVLGLINCDILCLPIHFRCHHFEDKTTIPTTQTNW